MHDIVFRDGLVVTPTGIVTGGVAVDDGRIAVVGPDDDLGSGHQEVLLDGRILFPGLMDPHVHFGGGDNLSDDTMREDFRYNSRDCLVGGVTTVATTILPGRDPLLSLVDRARKCGDKNTHVDYKVTAVVGTRAHVDQIPEAIECGVVSFKFFTGYIGAQAEAFGMEADGVQPSLFLEACEQIAKGGGSAFAAIHAEEPTVRDLLIDRLKMEGGDADLLKRWAETSPEWAEALQVFTYAHIAKRADVTIYPVHISSAYTLETIRHLRAMGISITAETLALFLSTTAEEMDDAGMGGKAKIQPPIRHNDDREALWRAVADGTISTIGTDSLTYSSLYKGSTDFWDCRVGVNLQVADTIPLMMEGVNRGDIDLVTLAKLVSENSARRYGLFPKKGAIVVGSDADLVVIDQDKESTLGVDRYRGHTDYSLWQGRAARGVPVMTFLRGKLVMSEGEIVDDKPSGEFAMQKQGA